MVAGSSDRRSRRRDQRATIATLSTPQLSALWRKSAVGLLAADSTETVLEVVAARDVMVAELERRDPVSMAAWLAAGAVEPDGPPAYLLGVRSMSSRER